MATTIPPPSKKARIEQARQSALPPTTSVPTPNVIVQLRSAADGTNLGPSISLPASADKRQLGMLVNQLKGNNEDPVPFAFSLSLAGAGTSTGTGTEQESTTLPLHNGTLTDLLLSHPNLLSTESVLSLLYEPEAVFRVREIRRCSSTIQGHGAPILCASFSPTGRMLATGSGDKTARIWDLETETPRWTLTGHEGSVLCVEWDARERILATGGQDGQVRLWDPKKGKQLGTPLKGHSKYITCLAWEPIHLNATSPRLASSSADGSVRIWSPLTRSLEFALGGHTGSVRVVRWSGEGVIYTGGNDRTVKVWDAKDGKLIRTLAEHAHWVNTIALNTDFILRTGPYDHLGKAVEDDAEAQSLSLARYQTFTSLSPEVIITGSDDHTLFLFSPLHSSTPKKPLARMTGHQKTVNHVAFSPDGRLAASASFDNHVKLWDGRTGKFVATLRGHVGSVYRVSWSADSRLLVSCSKDSTLKLWDLRTNKIKVDLPGHTDEVFCVDFVADKVASGGRDKTLKIWRN